MKKCFSTIIWKYSNIYERIYLVLYDIVHQLPIFLNQQRPIESSSSFQSRHPRASEHAERATR